MGDSETDKVAPHIPTTETDPVKDIQDKSGPVIAHAAGCTPHALESAEEGNSDFVKKQWWWQRPTIHRLKHHFLSQSPVSNAFDDQWNIETRLPPDESVSLGGITLVEAFTPATVSNLYDALRKWQRLSGEPHIDYASELNQRRVSGSGGWINLGYVRHPGALILPGHGFTDSLLPECVEAVWLNLTFLIPSVAFVCATFTIKDKESDLSDILRSDFHHETTDVRLTPTGHLSSIRAHIPFSRPKDFRMSSRMSDAISGKRNAVESRVEQIHASCLQWFSSQFKGRIAEAEAAMRPTIRLIFTKEAIPFAGNEMWRQAANLDWGFDVFRGVDLKGWNLKGDSRISIAYPFTTTIAARRRDVGSEETADRSGQSNWSLTQRFNDEHAALAVRFALRALLEIYVSRLAELRDRAATQRRFRRPVREARELETYLLRDGLDAATITANVTSLTENLNSFRWNVPEYLEDRGDIAGTSPDRKPIDLVPALCSTLRDLSTQLSSDTSHTEGNVRASAELRQSISNTRLQRFIVWFALAALITSVIGMLVK